MFQGAEAFNQNICMWDLVTEVFNQEIGGCDFSISIGFHNNPKKQILMFVITASLVLTAF
jgi:hypothetical protein